MLYLAALAAIASVLFSRLVLHWVGRLRDPDRRLQSAAWIAVWGSLTALCWWTMFQAPPLAVFGAALHLVWYAFEATMLVHEHLTRTRSQPRDA
ncbi:MAG: hypothetical protein AAGG50_02940 [Bacteroidota bacterium]